MNSEPSETHKESKANGRPNKVPPVPSNASEIAKIPSGSAKRDAAKEPDWQRRHHRVQVAAVIVGAVVALIYGCQLNEMRKSTVAATNAANAATDSVRFARENAHLEQRAWVAPTTVSGKPAQLNNPFEIQVAIKNTGKTFAKRLSGVVIIKYKELSQPDPDFAAEEATGENAFNPGLLAPNDTVIYTVPAFGGNKLTQEQMDLVQSPISIILVFGRIRYWDIFECEHWTTFSYRCTPVGDCYHYAGHSEPDNNRCP